MWARGGILAYAPDLELFWQGGGIVACTGGSGEKRELPREVRSYRKTAAAMTVVQRPSITPSAAWQVWVVLMIRPLAL